MKYIETDSEQAFEYIKTHNVFLTGPPGCGKSYLTKQYIEYCINNKITVAVTASTGIAAKLIGGNTIHSWSGIQIVEPTDSFDKILARVLAKPKIVRRWKRAQALIIDEISLLDKLVLEYLDKIAKNIRTNNNYFGGIKLLLVGDFFQLPPINGEFCFTSEIWENMFDYGINLNKIYRSDDIRLNKILRTIRKAKPLKKNMIKALEARISDKEIYPILTPLRNNARYYNENKMKENPNPEYVYNAKFSENCNNEMMKKAVLNMSPLEEKLVLKKDCTVVCLINDNLKGLVNGMVGVVIGFINESPIVNFEGTNHIMEPYNWSKVENEQKIEMTQIPLLLAYALTIHRCQGMTLNQASILLNRNVFECGQAYVALSRLKSLDNLYLLKFNPNVFKVNEMVKEYYRKSFIVKNDIPHQ